MKKKDKAEGTKYLFPVYCDFSCPHAGFSSPDAVGACRKDVAVFCKKAKKFNKKNSNCIFRK